MRIEIINKNGKLHSVYSYDTELSFNLFINTRNKNVFYDSVESGDYEMTFFFDEVSDQFGPDFVQLIAENEHDEEILDRIAFENHTKDQLWICFLSEAVYRDE